MRMIDADVLKKEKTYLWDEVLGHTACVLVEDIDAAPTIDAVEVVRCGKCANREEGMVLWCNIHGRAVDCADFCNKGERNCWRI